MKAFFNDLRSPLLASLFIISMIISSPPLFSHNSLNDKYKGFFFELSYADGLGAVICAVIEALNLYDQGSMVGLHVNLDQGLYVDPNAGPNWWEYFFEPIHLGNLFAPHYRPTTEEGVQLVLASFQLPRKRAFEIIQKYIRLKPHIQAEIDAFVKQHFKSCYVIGVHHRGTDKGLQWPLVSYEKTHQAIKQAIKDHYLYSHKKKIKIFVATDDQNFISYLESFYPSQLIYTNFIRSTDSTPLHYGNVERYNNNYQKGKEALIDSLLLSRCQALIRPKSSALSHLSTFFNADVSVTSLVPN